MQGQLEHCGVRGVPLMGLHELCELWLRPTDGVLCFRYHGALDITTTYPVNPRAEPRISRVMLLPRHITALNLMTERHRFDARLAHTVLAWWLLDGPLCPPADESPLASLNAARSGDFGLRPEGDERLYYIVEADRYSQLAVSLEPQIGLISAIERFSPRYLRRLRHWREQSPR
ncbi:MAG: hypothetical protein II007_05990 [Gammaproteobacteria bacterium]|nr:hypothetical protein [Gammaproteobacteria bacterium]